MKLEISLHNVGDEGRRPAEFDDWVALGGDRVPIVVEVVAPVLKKGVRMRVSYLVANRGPWGLLNLIAREAGKGFERAA